jgi:hypothetical protein
MYYTPFFVLFDSTEKKPTNAKHSLKGESHGIHAFVEDK